MTIVATGQITIVDNNDARLITAFITASPGTQQAFSKDESATSYSPDWTTVNSGAGLQLTARVFISDVSGPVEITGQLSNRRWSVDQATAITGANALISSNAPMAAAFVSGAGLTFTTVHSATTSTLTVKSNLLPSLSQEVIYFDADYTDPATGLVARVTAQLTLGVVRTGTNAVYLQTRGSSVIENATGTAKNVIAVGADLIRAAGVDSTGVTYRWFENNGATQIITGAPSATKYGLKTTTPNTVPTGSVAEIGVNLPASGAFSPHNTLVIHESAVANFGIFRVEARDADNVVFQGTFTVYDVSDPYTCTILSSSGDKLQNGVGQTTLIPLVYYGGAPVANLAGWTFTWTFNNRDGKRGAFIDTTRTAAADGRAITVNTSGVSSVITYGGSPITFAAGNIVKVVLPGGSERFYEVASGTGNTVTIRTPVTNAPWLTFTNWPAPAAANDLVGGVLYVCTGNGGQVVTSGAAPVVLTGQEVDVKALVTVTADRP